MENLTSLQKAIIQLIRNNGSMDRDRICRILSKARTTVYDDIVPLLKADILKTQKHQIKPKGRKNVYYVLGDVIV